MADVAASVQARLLKGAHQRGENFNVTLARYAAERFLARLGRSSVADRYILKGASMLTVWTREPYRGTEDIDLLASGAPDAASIHALVTEVCALSDAEDGLVFDLGNLRVEPIRATDAPAGQRATFTALLKKARIRVQVDFGIGGAVEPAAQLVEYPALLAGTSPARLLGYPREATIAEKFHAMLTLGRSNSRMKDFHDLWALSGLFGFDGEVLQRACGACFARRGTPWSTELPLALAPAFYDDDELRVRWARYLVRRTFRAPPPTDFPEIGKRLLTFLGPIRASILVGETFALHWPPGGPWQ